MLELCSIASGSSGNCICVGSDDSHVLIDAGISGKRIENGLNAIDLTSKDMQGILITHEHIDHVKSVGTLSKKYNIPVFATEKTWSAMPTQSAKIEKTLQRFFSSSINLMRKKRKLPIP